MKNTPNSPSQFSFIRESYNDGGNRHLANSLSQASNDLNNALTASVAGDEIVLNSGVYTMNSNITETKFTSNISVFDTLSFSEINSNSDYNDNSSSSSVSVTAPVDLVAVAANDEETSIDIRDLGGNDSSNLADESHQSQRNLMKSNDSLLEIVSAEIIFVCNENLDNDSLSRRILINPKTEDVDVEVRVQQVGDQERQAEVDE
jgi:hypothetical protein